MGFTLFIWLGLVPYIVVLMLCAIRNRREMKRQQNWIFSGSLPNVSLLIAFRNEASRIQPLLDSLEALEFPKDKLEIIMADDHSEDNSATLIRGFAASNQLNIQVLRLPEGETGKKAAIAMARRKATAEYLFFTDADAKLPAAWLTQMLACRENSGASMVCSEVEIVYRGGLLNAFEALEQAALVAFSAAAVAQGKAFLCNGAGYLVKKQALENISLSDAWHRSPGGDDVMLLHAMQEAGEKIAYCRLKASRVQLEPAGLSEFFWQRIRWGSKVFLQNASGNFFPALLVWLFHLLCLWIFAGIFIETGLFGILYCILVSFLTRGIWESALVIDFISPTILTSGFMKKGNSISHENEPVKKPELMISVGIFTLFAPVYSLYVVLAGPLLFFFRGFTWKGRTYSSR